MLVVLVVEFGVLTDGGTFANRAWKGFPGAFIEMLDHETLALSFAIRRLRSTS
jgi:hypothetical protein